MSTSGLVNTPKQFISILSGTTSPGNMVFNLTSYGALVDVNRNLTVIVCAVENEIALAKNIETQLTAQLVDIVYSGIPVFSSQQAPATFRVMRTDHIVCLWSQVAFDLSLTSDNTGAISKLSSDAPALCTIPFFQDYAATRSIALTDDNSEPFTEGQLASIITDYSHEIIVHLGHYVALCTYLNVFSGNDQNNIALRPTPGYLRDKLAVRHKSRGFTSEEDQNTDNIIPYPSNLFNWNKVTGVLVYRPISKFVDMKLPWRRDNEVNISIQAGYKFIPEPIQMAIVRLFGLVQSGEIDFKSLGGGSFKVELNNPNAFISRLARSIRDYKSK